MSENVNRPTSSLAAAAQERRRNLLQSPSLDSDVISGSLLPSSISEEIDGNDNGWVIFSPQLGADTQFNPTAENAIYGSSSFDTIEPLDLSTSVATQPAEELQVETSWELPSHNGTGTFSTPSSSRLDLFERVNAWRMEQSQMAVDEGHHARDSESSNVWRKLKENASRTLEQCFAWDEQTIDALFSKEFPRNQDKAGTREIYTREHLSRARKHGPPDWEERILHNTVHKGRAHEPSLLYSVLSQLLAWSKLPDTAPHSKSRYSHMMRRNLLANAFDNGDHSYHMGAIQGSIATVSSTMSATPWSETWDSGTSTSLGLAAA